MLTALSLGAGGGAGFRPPPPGRFGGAGGVGFAFVAAGRKVVPLMPFVDADVGGGGGAERTTGWGGAMGGGRGLGASSAR